MRTGSPAPPPPEPSLDGALRVTPEGMRDREVQELIAALGRGARWLEGASQWAPAGVLLLEIPPGPPGSAACPWPPGLWAELTARFPAYPPPEKASGLAALIRYLAEALQPSGERALFRCEMVERDGVSFVTIPIGRPAVASSMTRLLGWLAGRLLSPGDPRERSRALEKASGRFRHLVVMDRGKGVHPLLIGTARQRGLHVQLVAPRRLQLGEGRRLHLLYKHFSDHTSHLCTMLSSDKVATARRLGEAGLPVPIQRVVTGATAAVRAARQLGLPVVVKPRIADLGMGVTVGAGDDGAVAQAFTFARRFGKEVVVETMLPGKDHRFLVIGGRLVGVVRRDPASVFGDGVHTLEDLISITNSDPRRGPGVDAPLHRIRVTPQMVRFLARSSRTLGTIPAAGEEVVLESASNMALGGTGEFVLPSTHPDNRQLALDAARVLRIDIAVVDVLLPDVARSWRETGGGICEVNVTPGMQYDLHRDPSRNVFPDVAGAILDHLFPPGTASRVSMVVLLEGLEPLAGQLVGALERLGMRAGHASRDRIRVAGSFDEESRVHHAMKCRRLLRDPRLDAIVLELDPGAVMRHGLGATHLDLLVRPSDLSSSPELDWMESLAADRMVVEAGTAPATTVTDITRRLGFCESAPSR